MAWFNPLHLLLGPLLAVPLIGYTLALSPPPARDYLAAHFRELDQDRDGQVSLPEYLASWGLEKEGPERQFRELDRDGDGLLTLAEYLAIEERWVGGAEKQGVQVLSGEGLRESG